MSGGLGIGFTRLNLTEYFSNGQTSQYVARNAVLFFGAAYPLPGVFDDVPYKNLVNGSLWTMFYELRMYTILVLAWLAARLLLGGTRQSYHWVLILAAAVGAVAQVIVHFRAVGEPSPFWHLFFMFLSGAAIYVIRDRIVLTRRGSALAAVAILISSMDVDVFFLVYSACFAYTLFFLAYVPAGAIRRYNRLGDYSYGIYIYAFPVQQAIVAVNPGMSPWAVLWWASLVTLALAVLSWTLLEQRMLRLKSHVVMHTRRVLRLQTLVHSRWPR